MKNVLNYTPEVKYTKKNVDTINNILDLDGTEERKGRDYTKHIGSDILSVLYDQKSYLSELMRQFDLELKDVVINLSSPANIVPDESKNYSDLEKLIYDKVITYSLYKDCVNDDGMQDIVDRWDIFCGDIDGNLKAEALPYLLYIISDVENAINIVESTITYGKEYKNIEDLKQQELVEIERFNDTKRELEALYREDYPDVDLIEQKLKYMGSKEAQLRFNRSLTILLEGFSNKVRYIIESLTECLEDSPGKSTESIDNIKSIGVSKDQASFLIYNGFKKKRDAILSCKKEYDSVFSSYSKGIATKNAVTAARLYLDVSVPVLDNISFSDIEQDEEVIGYLLDGIEDIVESNKSTIIDFNNILDASVRIIENQLTDIKLKEGVREVYRKL